VSFSPDGRRIVSTGADRLLILWDATGKPLQALAGHQRPVHKAVFGPDGRVATASDDKTVGIWEIGKGREYRSAFVALAPPLGLAGLVHVWNAAHGPFRRLTGHTSRVLDVAFSRDGTRLVSGGVDQTVRIWDAKTFQTLHILTGHTDDVTAVTFSPDGRLVASGSQDWTVRLWDAATGRPVLTFDGHSGSVTSVSWTGSGKNLLSADAAGTIRYWEAATGRVVQPIAGSPDAGKVAAAQPGRPQTAPGAFVGSPGSINVATLSPDGRWIGRPGGTAPYVWEVATGSEKFTFPGSGPLVRQVAFSGDGSLLAGGCSDGTVKVWPLPQP
jgi:WD40 repeat protein